MAERKAAALLDAGARVRVGAPQLQHALAQWTVEGRVEHLEGEFQPAWLDEVWLVIAATDSSARWPRWPMTTRGSARCCATAVRHEPAPSLRVMRRARRRTLRGSYPPPRGRAA
ncbi:MAG: hypothetical protein EPN49_15385 [Rhodanobacter sp.]|nr:MAG: hypothetical protein EPN49_15385 [Rhodanobacter sp.]